MLAALHQFDTRVTAWVQSAPAVIYRPMLAITNAGQPLTVILLAIGIIVWALWQGHNLMGVAGSVVLATVILSSLLKLVLRRTRPQTEYVQKMFYASFSFPSGHSAAATVGFGFLAYLAWMSLPGSWSLVAAITAIGFALMVCLSRVYLGAHFPSDVIGGIALGLIGLGINIFIVRPLV